MRSQSSFSCFISIIFPAVTLYIIFVPVIEGESYDNFDNTRCKCICPNPQVVYNTSHTNSTTNSSNRTLYISSSVLPNKCTCDDVVLPRIEESSISLKGKEGEFCPRCKCVYESRNLGIIKFVVSLVMWVVSLLMIYMLFLMCLDPLLNKRIKNTAYQEHTNEDDDAVGGSGTSHPMRVTGGSAVSAPVATSSGPTSGVLNRVGHHQNKWKRQVQEQRRNIYDRHTILN